VKKMTRKAIPSTRLIRMKTAFIFIENPYTGGA